jgi:ligand-binding sensor domain-containing protein/signal transduction histidine kinase
MKRTLLLALLLAACFYSKAQTAHVYFEKLDIKKGLPESYVRAMVQDSEGYMWLSTQNGLVRYDGYNYKVYYLGSDKVNVYPVTSVGAIIKGDDKSIWVSTLGNGIFRYNRKTDTFDQFALPAKFTKSFFALRLVDNDGNVWGNIDNNGPKAFKLDPATKKYQFFGNSEKGSNYINANVIMSLRKTADGKIWIGTDNGIYNYAGSDRPLKGFLVATDSAKYIGVNPLYEAPSQPGLFWINLFHGNNVDLRIACLDAKTGKIIKEYRASKNLDSVYDAGVYDIYEDKKQRLWFASEKGLARLDRQTGKFTNYLTNDTTVTQLGNILEDKNGKLWMQPANGLLYFDPETARFEFYKRDPDQPGSLKSNIISTKLIDNNNNLWVGLSRGGINKISKTKSAFELVSQGKDALSGYPGGVSRIISSASGRTKILNAKGLFIWDTSAGRFTRFYASAPGQLIADAWEDGNILYIATSDGFVVYNVATGTKTTYRHKPADDSSIPGNQISKVYKDHTGTVWLAIAEGPGRGICSFEPTNKKFTRYPYHGGTGTPFEKNDGALDDARVISIYEDMQNTIWVGTNFGGLNKFDRKTGKFFSYLPQNKKLTCISAIYEDRSGRFWVGTYQLGLFEFDRKKGVYTHQLNERNGLLYNGIIGIKEDSVGHIWVGTDRGLTRLDAKTMAFRNFKTDDILPGADLASLEANSLADSRFVLSTSAGLALFNPRDLDDDPYPPQVHIESIRYNTPGANDSLAITALASGLPELNLSYNKNSVQFNYIGLQYENPEGNTYAYMLVGYDKQWVQAGTNRSVTYNNLPAGTYTFKVKAANSSGVWSEKEASILVVISPPWYFSWWAWILWVVIFAAAIYYYVKYRSQQLIYENQLLEEKVEERTNELKAANKELSEQQSEITSQRDRLASTVTELKAAQTQLIQSEKLASLGELTAGIAHEIQNPLNFVNNFSEVSIELAVEMKQELRSGSKKEALSLADDIVLNLEKIIHHGKRADGIVKNMLQHSRTNSGEKHLTDMNALVDEYLRLSYHGLRAKDKNFNADMVLDLDPDLPKIKVIPPDLGRVMLNLFNNAFYAVQVKKKTAGKKYKPLVEVSTSLFTPPKGKAEIRIYVKDNGNGIPDANKEKIMQPFFTTKPTGEGTGLGLSLSYDIVTKGHGGKMDMSSKEGDYTEFTIQLPVS